MSLSAKDIIGKVELGFIAGFRYSMVKSALCSPNALASGKVDAYIRVFVCLGHASIPQHLAPVRGGVPAFDAFGSIVATLSVVPNVIVSGVRVPLVDLVGLWIVRGGLREGERFTTKNCWRAGLLKVPK